jgi:hypothetical protein
MSSDFTRCVNRVIITCDDDWTDVSGVLWHVSDELGININSNEAKTYTLRIIRYLLTMKYVYVGIMDDNGIANWNLAVDKSIDRISTEWDSLGKLPGLSDICWLAITDAGKRYVRTIGPEQSGAAAK